MFNYSIFLSLLIVFCIQPYFISSTAPDAASSTPPQGSTQAKKGGGKYAPASLCDTGVNQSPINIDTKGCMVIKNYSKVEFADENLFTNDLQLENNCETVEITLVNKAIKAQMKGGPLGTGPYHVYNIHFHWGYTQSEGCEHTIDGIQYPLELHIVTFKDPCKTLAEALKEKDGVAAIAFLFSISKTDNEKLNPIIEALKKISSPNSKTQISGSAFSFLKDFVSSTFYTYRGSLTTHTCDEVILWTIFTKMIDISQKQLDTFHDIVGEDGEELRNWRKPKPLNGRKIELSEFL